ncbi:MAG TPA: oxidoreductase [Solirubrobacteraceae bacterium]|nr:oxidoreductase [Solirubrobacteraceae bacterium]
MPWTTADIPPQAGRTAVVTGANGGLGLEIARALAGAGAHVVMAARNAGTAAAAHGDILAAHPHASLEIVSLDLASLASVRAAAERIGAAHGRVDLLVNNAGVMAVPERRTADGFEMQFGVNHLGHWTLTALLLPALLAAPAARVVTVTSTAHHFGRRLDPDNPHLHGNYRPFGAYCQSKLANFHFGLGLQRDFARAGVRAASLLAHPGLSNTELQARSVAESDGGWSQRFWHVLARRTGMSPAEGALSPLRAATDPHAAGGAFYGPLFVNAGPPVRKPVLRRVGLEPAIARLWAVSERETGTRLDVAAARRA